MGRTAEKIGHLRKTASEHPAYREVLLPFERIFAYVEGKEGDTGIRFALPEGNWAERVAGGLPALSPESLSVDRVAAAPFLSGVIRVLKEVGREGLEELDRIERGVEAGALDLPVLFASFLSRERRAVEDAAKAVSVQPPLLAFVLEIPFKTALEHAAGAVDPARLDGWKEGYCPVCGSRAGMDELAGEEGKRYLSCSACYFRWPWPRVKCPFCGNDDPDTVSYFTAGEGPVRVGVCRKCSRYIKTRDSRRGNASVPLEAEDLATLHLDLLAGKEGFERGK
ncbi:MAG: formate dehydrogenase accessory protein FdhE [Deltaproteobacteria bacterium]|nr:MAG: formate dehydrogenase accessory protein FdhE [Deltaproteobacteria bacterium]